MHPVMGNDAFDASAFVKLQVVFRLKPGWSFDLTQREFVSRDGSKVSVGCDDLPDGA
jgi:hypothetical protein